MVTPQFAISPTEGHLGCFQFLMTMNEAAVNICVQVFMLTYVLIHLGKHLECNCSWVIW